MTDLRKPGAGFWIAVALVAVLVGYPLSFGPACSVASRGYVQEPTISSIYTPVLWSATHATWLANAVEWWGSLWVPEGELVYLFFDTDEADYVFEFGDPLKYVPHRDAMM